MNAATNETPPFTEYVFVDTAINGAFNRNRIMPQAHFNPPPSASDVFCTYLRYTNEFQQYAANNPMVAPEDRPSVKGFRGSAFATFLPADFDYGGDPNQAREDAARAVTVLVTRFDAPPSAVRVAFSGSKGFSLEIPGALFGGFVPAVGLPQRFKRLAAALFAECPTLDTSIYESVRLWRVANHRHGKTGLFKVRLSLAELRLDLDEIRRLAGAPRPYQDAADDDWFPRAGLVDLWASTAIPENDHKRDAGEAGSRLLTLKQEGEAIEIVERYWFQGQKHTIAFGLAGWLAIAGVPQEQAERMFGTLSANDQRPDDRLNCLRDSYNKRRLELPIAGPSRLRDYLPPEDMDALERILPTRARIIRASHRIRVVPAIRGRRLIVDLSGKEACRAS